MGLFSSKYETHVSTAVTRVIEDKALPNSIRTGALRSLIDHDDQMIEGVMEELTNCVGVKVNSMYNYGRDHYMHGLPMSSLQVSNSGEDLVKSTIELEVGGPITVEYYHYGMLNTLHIGWLKLMDLYAYNPITNTLVVGGNTVYLEDMQVVVKEATLAELQSGALDQWGPSAKSGATPIRMAMPDQAGHTPWTSDPLAPNDFLHVTYTWLNSASVMQTGTFDMQVTGFDEYASFHHVKYKKTSDGSIHYWLYKADGGLHPAIDKLHTPDWETGGTYFPWVYFRHDMKALGEDMSLDESKQLKKLTKYLNMEFDDVASAINENPDIDQVESAFIMMGVPAVSTNEMELRYLYDYFDSLFGVTGGSLGPTKQIKGLINQLVASTNSTVLDSAFLIQDKKFKMSIGFRNIFKTRLAGSVAPIGKHVMEHGQKTLTSTGANGQKLITNVTFHTYREQITESLYEEIEVQNLKVKYFAFQEFAVTANEEDLNILIPLDKSITENYSVPKREILYSRSLHYVFNSKVVQEVKWYMQSWFKGLMIVVAVIITIISLGSTWQLIVAAVAAGATVVAIAMILVMQIIRQLVIAYIIKLFVKLVGPKIAFLVAVIAIMYGGYQAMQAGSINGAPWAQELMALGNGLTKAIGEKFQDDFDALARDAEQFNDMVKSKQEKLEEAQNELGYNNFLAPTVVFGESPNDFYDRTVHSGNIGVMGLDAVTSYVEVALTLPKLNQTVGEDTNGNAILG